jgi:hypothetical protein
VVWDYFSNKFDRLSKQALLKLSNDLYKKFTENDWEDSEGENGTYGGPKWAGVINHLINYLEGKMNTMIFIDQSISLEHNGNIVVDKLLNTADYVLTLLNAKKEATFVDLPFLIYVISPTTKAHWYMEGYKYLSKIKGILLPDEDMAEAFENKILLDSEEYY